jgi:hypothetical protein
MDGLSDLDARAAPVLNDEAPCFGLGAFLVVVELCHDESVRKLTSAVDLRQKRYARAVEISAIEEALATVQRTLDKLTAAGCDQAAFELARAQYAASLRNSFPANLASVAATLTKLAGDTTCPLNEDERSALRSAAATFANIRHP